jgi:hypothetical protein
MSRSHATTRCALLGAQGELMGDAPDAVDGAEWLDGYNFALAGPIYAAGTNEIQRNHHCPSACSACRGEVTDHAVLLSPKDQLLSVMPFAISWRTECKPECRARRVGETTSVVSPAMWATAR